MRENYGGESIFALNLYSYISTGTFQAISHSLTKLSGPITYAAYSNYPQGNYPFLNTHKVSTLGDSLLKLSGGIDSKKSYDSDFIYSGPDAKPLDISNNKYTGAVYVLTGGMTFSAASTFVAMVYSNDRATIIGEETGGAYGDFCGGGFLNVTLPNSKFVLQIPFMRRIKSIKPLIDQGRGTIPHFIVEENLNSKLEKRDIEMERALELIRE